jgi:FKBP-type peptidyl-prolyl cis-trans isomerase
LLTTALSSTARGEDPALKTEQEKTLYALGFTTARTLEIYNLSEEDMDIVTRGIRDGVLKKDSAVPIAEYRAQIGALRDRRRKAALATQKKEAMTFVEEMASKPGATRTESGIVILEMKPGAGESPVAKDKVKVHYHGTLPNGTVFDSSVQRGQPATFPLKRVIPCWTEGVQTMKVGGKSQLVCPPDLAYGDRGSPPRIPPGTALVFEVELIEIVR